MSAPDKLEATLDTGIYSFPLAAQIIASKDPEITASRLRYWMKTGLTPSSYGKGTEGSELLSFLDLVSLEIVRRFRSLGVSLQKTRTLEARLRERHPQLIRPFAHEIFFTDGVTVWHQVDPEDSTVIEVVGKHRDQSSWMATIRSFAAEIHYDGGLASSWDLGRYVEVNPRVQFGNPVVKGTRLTVEALARELKEATAPEVASWHGLTSEQIEEVRSLADAA